MVGSMKNSGSLSLSDEIKTEAAAWIARLHADDRLEVDERAFQLWLAESPMHVAAFEAVNTTWEAAAGLPRDLRGFERRNSPVVRRRTVLAGLGTLFVVGGSLTFLRSANASVYQTDIGEQKHVTLNDGSQIFLDTDTRVVVKFGNSVRSVDLQYGRANFRVVPDIRRPFEVNTAERKIVAKQSNFDVRCDGEKLSIVLINGQLFIESNNNISHRNTEILRAGERLIATADQTTKSYVQSLAPLLAWQTGRAIFESQKLSDAVYEMNRYSTVKLEVTDDRIANLRVSGVYLVGDNVAFADSISRLLPIKVRQSNGQLYLDLDVSRSRLG